MRARFVLTALCAVLGMLVVAAPAFATAPSLVSSFDGSATPAGSMTPNRLAVNEETGDVYVIDSAHDVVNRFDANGSYRGQLLGSSTTRGSFGFGGGDDDIAVDNSGGANQGNVYVVGEQNGGPGLIAAFRSDGTFLWQVVSALPGADTCGIAVDSLGQLWVADYGNGVQQRRVSDGATLGSAIIRTGQSCHMAVESDGGFLVAQWDDQDINRYDRTGAFVATIDNSTRQDVSVDSSNGDIFTFLGSTQVNQYNASGSLVDGSPFGIGVFVTPLIGLDVNGRNHRLYVSDRNGRNVWIYGVVVRRTLTVTADGARSGSVSADQGLIFTCTRSGGTCSDEYDDGSIVTLTATPEAGAKVTWTGCDSVAGNRCTVTLDADANVTATFDLIPRYTLRVERSGTGSGTVTSAPAGIDCGATCDTLFDENTEVTLTAAARANSTFTGWSGGGCSGTGTCRVTLGGDTTVTATFAQDKPAVTTGAASSITQTGATVAGSVNPNGANVTDCRIEYGTTTSYGAQVSCSSAPGSGTAEVAVSASLSGLTAGTTYHYRVVATNAGGSTNGADQTFATASAPAPTCETDPSLCPKPQPGVLKLVSKQAKVADNKAGVKLSCRGDTACKGLVRVVTTVKVRKGKRLRTETVVLGKARISVAAGTTKTVKLPLTRAARKMLAKSSSVTATLVGPGVKQRVVLKAQKKNRS